MTSTHPCLARLSKQGRLEVLPSVFSAEKSDGALALNLLEQAEQTTGVIYATPGDPLLDDALAPELIARASARNLPVRLIRGLSLLDTALAALGLAPEPPGLQIVRPGTTDLDPSRPALAILPSDAEVTAALLRFLTTIYPGGHRCQLFLPFAERRRRQLRSIYLSQTAQALDGHAPGYLHLSPLALADRLQRFDTLKQIVAILRSPGGCPWDREQTHDSIKENLLEESYESLEALDSGDPAKMCEEFGDLLLQIMLHARMAEESGEFAVADVIAGISAKLVRRHPHVFGDVTVHTSQDVMINWEKIKRAERIKDAHMLASVPRHMPALAYAQAVQKRVARVGFDWPGLEGVLDKVQEEIEELRAAATQDEKRHELGDLLFALVNLGRWLGLDAEESLRLTNQRFYRRFSYIEDACHQRGQTISDLSLEEMDRLWEEAKRAEMAEDGRKGDKGKRRKV